MGRFRLLALLLSAFVLPAAAEEPTSSGTAFFVNAQGWAVTNAHVVEDCSRVTISGGGKVSDLKLDVANDLALVRVDGATSSYIAFRRSGARLGEDIAAFGYPLGSVLSSSVKITTGNVNSLMGLGDDTRYLQISTPVQPGNSGGPVVDRKGRLIGVTTSTLKLEAGGGAIPQNVNFALRAKTLESFLESRAIEFDIADDDGAELQTPDLAEKIQPAVLQLLCYGSETKAAGADALVSAPTPSPYRAARPFSTLDGHDVVGFDYATMRNVTRSQCQSACNDDQRCRASTYNKRERFCFMKSDAKLLVRNDDAFAIVSDELSSDVVISSFVIGAGRDMAGGDYRRFQSDFNGCYLKCETDRQCRAFSFVRKTRTCWLKNVVGQVRAKTGVDTGIK